MHWKKSYRGECLWKRPYYSRALCTCLDLRQWASLAAWDHPSSWGQSNTAIKQAIPIALLVWLVQSGPAWHFIFRVISHGGASCSSHPSQPPSPGRRPLTYSRGWATLFPILTWYILNKKCIFIGEALIVKCIITGTLVFRIFIESLCVVFGQNFCSPLVS